MAIVTPCDPRASKEKHSSGAFPNLFSFFLVSVIYLACFSLLLFGGAPTQFTWLLGSFVIAAAISGLILPVLTGAALTLYFTQKKLEYLVNESAARHQSCPR